VRELAAHLRELCGQVRESGERLPASEWRAGRGAGKWSRLQIAGHLIDSAANNHQRFVRALAAEAYAGPGYQQDDCMRVQAWAEADPENVLALLISYNLHLAHVIARIPPGKELTPCTIGQYSPMPLRSLVEDYVAHLEHHLRQFFDGMAGPAYSGLPWPPGDGRWT
jgi:hypothetical protein